MKSLLEVRKLVKGKKPKKFLRSDSNRINFKNKWRKPRGLHNKRRLNKAGHQKNPSQGYRSPVWVRGLHKSGLELITIYNKKDLQEVNPEKQIVEIASTVGLKKKFDILEECKSKSIKVANVKDVDKFLREEKERLEKIRKEKEKKLKEREKAKKEAIKKAEEKKETKKETKEEVKEEVLKAELKQEAQKEQKITKTKDPTQAKKGHQASSVPGTKQ